MTNIILWTTLGLSAIAAVFGIVSYASYLFGKGKAKREQRKAEKKLKREIKSELKKKLSEELKKGK